MVALESRMTEDGTVVIPTEARERLGIKPGDIVRFTIVGSTPEVAPTSSVIDRLYGSLRSEHPPLSDDELHELVEQAMVDEAIERMDVGDAATPT